jgi:hypothetical protein
VLFCRQSPGARETVGILLLVVFGVFVAVPTVQAQPKLSLVEERGVFVILADGRVLLRVRFRGSYASCEERAKAIFRRLQEVFAASWKSPPTFRIVREQSGAFSAFCGGKRLFSVFREDARSNSSNPLDLAILWLNEVQMAFYGVSEGTCEAEEAFTGLASFCHPKFDGRKTSSGEVYSSYAFTAAHRTLPLGSVLLVTNPKNGKRVVVKVNDRGPWRKNRVVDLSLVAAKALGIEEAGVNSVRIEVIRWKKR